MLRLMMMTGLSLGLMTGCATTSKLMSFGGGDSPMQQVLKAQPEIAQQHQNTAIQQVFNRVESPTVSRVTVLQTGLADDAVRAIRTEYLFKLNDKKWQLQNKQQSYQCARPKASSGFQTQLCS